MLSKRASLIVGAVLSVQVVLIVVSVVGSRSEGGGAASEAATTTAVSSSAPPTTTTTTPVTTTTTAAPVTTATTTWDPPAPADGTNVSACADMTCDVIVSRGTEIPVNRAASQYGPAYTQLYRVAAMDHEGRAITLHSLSRLNGQPIFTVDLHPLEHTESPDYTIMFVNFLTPDTAHVQVCGTVPADQRYGYGCS